MQKLVVYAGDVLFMARLFIFIMTALSFFAQTAVAEIESNLLLKARNFALVDGYQKLRANIGDTMLNPALKTRDYLAEKPEMQEEFERFLLTAEQLGETRIQERPDRFIGAETDMRITFLSFKQFMSKMQFYRGPGKLPPDLSGLSTMKPIDFTVTGQAVINRSAVIPAPASDGKEPEGSEKPLPPSGLSPISGIAGWEHITTAGRLKTEQTALSDARRKLAGLIEAMPLTETLTVSDLTAANEAVRTQLTAFIQGLSPLSPYRYYEGGIVEVDLGSPVETIIFTLEKARISEINADETLQTSEVFRTPIMRMLEWLETDMVTATGSASANPDDYREQSDEAVSGESIPSWVYRSLEASGIGISQPGATGRAGQRTAVFNAQLNARQALVEKAYELKIDKETTIADFVNEREENKDAVGLFLGGMKLASEPEFLDDGSVKVTVTIELEKLWHIVNQNKKGGHYEH